MQVAYISLGIEASIRNVPLVAEFKLKTRVLHITHIADRLCLTYITWDRHGNQHTVGLLHIVIGTECQCTAEEAEVETDISLFTLLPLQVWVGCSIRLRAIKLGGILTEEYVVAHRGQHCVAEITDIIVTILTPAGTEFQVAQPVASALHKFFIHDVPSNRCRWESTILIIGSETA